MLTLDVLLVEDDAVNRLFASTVLRRFGCEVTVAANGAEGLELCRERVFHAVFMDCYMPLLDGFEASLAIRELGGWASVVPIIALTASVTASDRRRAERSGMTAFLVKPIDRALLEVELQRAADRVRPLLSRRAR